MNPIAPLLVLLSAVCPCTSTTPTDLNIESAPLIETNYSITDSTDAISTREADSNINLNKSTMPFKKADNNDARRQAPTPKREKHKGNRHERNSEVNTHNHEHNHEHNHDKHDRHTKDIKHNSSEVPTMTLEVDSNYTEQKQALDFRYERMFELMEKLNDNHNEHSDLSCEYKALRKNYTKELNNIVSTWVTNSLT